MQYLGILGRLLAKAFHDLSPSTAPLPTLYLESALEIPAAKANEELSEAMARHEGTDEGKEDPAVVKKVDDMMKEKEEAEKKEKSS